jgi:hypothetical protein
MSSSSADKLTLYANLFDARTDVYAMRWESSRTGAAGWMPAVAGGWRKGMVGSRVVRAARGGPEDPHVVTTVPLPERRHEPFPHRTTQGRRPPS